MQTAHPPTSAEQHRALIAAGTAITLQLVLSQHSSPPAPACRGMAPMTHEIEVLTF